MKLVKLFSENPNGPIAPCDSNEFPPSKRLTLILAPAGKKSGASKNGAKLISKNVVAPGNTPKLTVILSPGLIVIARAGNVRSPDNTKNANPNAPANKF